MRTFFHIMLFLDEKVSHPLWDLLNNIFDKENNGEWYDKYFYKFCMFCVEGYDNTHPEELEDV